MKNLLYLVYIFLIFFTSDIAATTVISGKVIGNDGLPLAYANVYIKETSTGTTTNLEGYYKLEVADGPHEIVFRYLGYKMRVEMVEAKGIPVNLNVTLQTENYTLTEVKILPDGADPAYAIIRNAIAKRKFYLTQVDEYSCDVYVKGLQKITKYPEKILGVEVNL